MYLLFLHNSLRKFLLLNYVYHQIIGLFHLYLLSQARNARLLTRAHHIQTLIELHEPVLQNAILAGISYMYGYSSMADLPHYYQNVMSVKRVCSCLQHEAINIFFFMHFCWIIYLFLDDTKCSRTRWKMRCRRTCRSKRRGLPLWKAGK